LEGKKELAGDIAKVYHSVTVAEAELNLAEFGEKWDGNIPAYRPCGNATG
jgi:hypothetical protein